MEKTAFGWRVKAPRITALIVWRRIPTIITPGREDSRCRFGNFPLRPVESHSVPTCSTLRRSPSPRTRKPSFNSQESPEEQVPLEDELEETSMKLIKLTRGILALTNRHFIMARSSPSRSRFTSSAGSFATRTAPTADGHQTAIQDPPRRAQLGRTSPTTQSIGGRLALPTAARPAAPGLRTGCPRSTTWRVCHRHIRPALSRSSPTSSTTSSLSVLWIRRPSTSVHAARRPSNAVLRSIRPPAATGARPRSLKPDPTPS
jgi:hypothetical protein